MRRLVPVIILLGLIGAFALPTAAQTTTGDIIDVLVEDGQFTTLVAALQSAELEDLLRTDGPFTLFAPTDDAFMVTLGGLGITPEEFFADHDALRNALLYHVADGNFPAETLGMLTTLTTVSGADVGITTTTTGMVLNGATDILRADMMASNGTIHVIDSVLMPATEVVVVDTPMVGDVQVRVAQFSPDAPAVDFYLNGEISGFAALEFGDVSEWAQFPAGTYEVAVVPQGSLIDEAVFGPLEVTFAPLSWTTIATLGSETTDTMTIALIDQNVEEPLAADRARVTVFHSIENAPGIDIRLADNIVLFDNIQYSQYSALDLPTGVVDLQVVATGTTDPVLFDLPDFLLEPGNRYLVSVTGTPELPNVAVQTVTAAEIDALLVSMAAQVTPVPVLVNSGDIVDSLAADGRFTILVSAIEASGLDETLRGAGPFTLLAPTDEAFAALPPGTLETLLQDPVALSNLLLYHVLIGSVAGADFESMTSFPTVLGMPLTIQFLNGAVMIDGTTHFVGTDLATTNGVIHAVDTVLMPPAP